MPLLSIVIPTKNRSTVVFGTVSWLLSFSFKDMEVVVIDNDDTEATSEILSQCKDSRLRIVRTGGLNMADNWEKGFSSAEGDYIFVIGDKARVNPKVLPVVLNRIKSHSPQVMVLRLNGYPHSHVIKYDASGWGIKQSSEIIDLLRQGEIMELICNAPLGYKAIISKELVRSIQHKFKRIAFPVAPDFTSCCMVLFNSPVVHHCRIYPTDIVDYAPSNGRSSQYRGATFEQFLSQYKLTPKEAFAYAPLPIYAAVNNLAYSGFLHMASIAGQDYSQEWFMKIPYAKAIYEDLMDTHLRYHIDVSADLQMLYTYLEKNNIMDDPQIYAMFDKYDLRDLKSKFLRHFKSSVKDYLKRKTSKILCLER